MSSFHFSLLFQAGLTCCSTSATDPCNSGSTWHLTSGGSSAGPWSGRSCRNLQADHDATWQSPHQHNL